MIIDLIDSLFWIYMLMLFVRILGSWVPEFQDHPIMRFIAHYTDPYLNIFKSFIPPIGMIDISPIVAFLFLNVIEILVKSLVTLLFL